MDTEPASPEKPDASPAMVDESLTSVTQAVVLYRSAMLRTFGLLFHILGLGFLLRNLRMEQHSGERVRRAATLGPLVYVLQNRSVLDLLALNVSLNAHRLPLASFANGVRLTAFMPIPEMFDAIVARLRRLRRRPLENPVQSSFLADLLAIGVHACLFLSPQALSWRRLFGRPEPDPIPSLLAAQQRSSRPIQVLPVVVVWNRAPPAARQEVGRFLLGNQDVPGFFGKIWAVLTRTGHVLIQVGEPVDLERYIARDPKASEARRARVLRIVLSRFLFREQTVIRGPRMRSPGWMRRLVLQSPSIRDFIKQEAALTGQSEGRILTRLGRIYDRMAARFSFTMVLIGEAAVRFLWNRIYSGVDVRASDFDNVRKALRRGTPIIVPCHRSHLDYLLLSTILFEHDIAIPHVVAGMNLSFWPLGAIFRRLGAFFIKRTFRGDRLFPPVFSAYVEQLVRDGFPIEFFIEGGRSRTGKLLQPKLGVLGMIMNAAAVARRDDFDVTLLPVSINYEQIAEEGAYVRELAGEKKKDETLRDVASATKVLRTRYGRVYLRFGDPISANSLFDELPKPWNQLGREKHQEILEEIGERILHCINRQVVALPTSLVAAAFLAQIRRGIRRDALLARVERFRAFLERDGVELSATLQNPAWAVEEALKRFLSTKKVTVFDDEDGPVYRITEEGRAVLEYYKNTILHAFVPASLLALVLRRASRAVVADTDGPDDEAPPRLAALDLDAARESVRTLIYLFRHEFIFDPGSTEDELLDQAVKQLVASGALREVPAGDERPASFQVADRARLSEMAALTANFAESYWIVLKAAHGLRQRDLDREALTQAIRKLGVGMLAVEDVRRPEALSIANLRNAVRVFVEDGVFRLRSDGGGLEFEDASYKEYLELLAELVA
jgi:glycerol-3-phosphate O-acyltransferase